MCTVYEFPMKKKLPKELEERIDKVSEEYVKIMAEALELLYDDTPTQENFDDFLEIMLAAFLASFEKLLTN